MFTQSTDGRIESPGRSRHNLNINNLLSNNNTPTTTTSNIQPVPLSPNRHRKSTSWHSQQVTNVNSDVHDPLLAMNAIGASLPAISVLQSGADHVFARVEEAAEGDRQEILSPLKLQKLKLQQRQLLESLNRERSNSSHLRIHKRPKDMGIISEETDWSLCGILLLQQQGNNSRRHSGAIRITIQFWFNNQPTNQPQFVFIALYSYPIMNPHIDAINLYNIHTQHLK